MCLCADPEGRVYIGTDFDIPSSATSVESISQYIEPASTQQVFTIQPVHFEDSRSKSKDLARYEDKSSQKLALKTANGKYLGVNADGSLNAKASAISAQQTFTIVDVSDELGAGKAVHKAFALMTTWKTFVTIKPSDKTKIGYAAFANPIDHDGQSDGHRLIIRMQARNQKSYQQKATAMNTKTKYNDKYISSQVLRDKAGRDLSKDEIRFLKTSYSGTLSFFFFFSTV